MRAVLLTLLIGIAGLGHARPAADPPRFDGEYGLWVEDRDSVLHVQWLTRAAGPGFLEVLDDGRRRASVSTPAGFRHAVPLRLPRGQRRVTLVYGAAADSTDRHTTTIRLQRPRRPRVSGPQPDSLFVFGDTHGEYDNVLAVLRNAGLVDGSGSWTGGRAHLAFLGDLVDRGPDVVRLLWFVYRLEEEAARAGGRIHVVLGNHELMVAMNDLRYVDPKELRLAEIHGIDYRRLLDFRRSVLGQWLASKPVLMRIGDVLVAHGGLALDPRFRSVDAVEDSLARYVSEDLFYYWGQSEAPVRIVIDSASLQRRVDFFTAERSVLWYREYVRSDSAGAELEKVLRRSGAKLHVVGHTPVEGGIQQRYGGRLIATNVVPAGSELLLLARRADGRLEPFRIGMSGPPRPLAPVTPAATP